MPRILNNHFREIEIKIVSEMAWQTGSPVVEIIKDQIRENAQHHAEEHKSEQLMQPFNMFFKRVLHLTAQRIYEMCELLGIKEEVKERIWSIMKMQLSTEPHILTNRHLDQLIMCSIYGVCKACQVP